MLVVYNAMQCFHDRTFVGRDDLFCEACEGHLARLEEEVELFRAWPKVFDEFFEIYRPHAPVVVGGSPIKQSVHDLNGFVGQAVRLHHSYHQTKVKAALLHRGRGAPYLGRKSS